MASQFSNEKIRRALIDIDNTLWDFAPLLYEKLKLINPSVPPPQSWLRWDFFKDYVSAEVFYGVIEEIHKRQDEYGVFPDAKRFLEGIRALGLKIVIGSHRNRSAEEATLRWLKKHDLPFDELHLSYDKTVLFGSVDLVVDDSPFVHEKAKSFGIMALGIEYPWNRNFDLLLFKNLTEILLYLENHLNS
ncbi:MAG: hypothetical protein NZ583_04125 [Desulfobacterota bacterium]|nr:hypothetical protein [Thermodesulfobacteriota bacterium]MDW8001544.1 hypothetical protein [Deltaproteobacteria bacterium]